MLRDLARSYYLDQGYNCAESLLLACNEQYDFGLGQKDILLMSAYGGGVCCGSVCGAILGSLAAAGRMQLTKCAHENPAFRAGCEDFLHTCETSLGSIHCSYLKSTFDKGDKNRCVATVEQVADIFENGLANRKLTKDA